jgi:uncharacterized protein (TIGR02147 family)
MTNKDLFNYSDYKAYLKAFIKAQPAKGHGYQAKIAKALSCHTAYVNQVLNREAHFSQEQAEDLNMLLNHNRDEALYFLLLVQLSRAGTKRLRDRLEAERQKMVSAQLNLKDRIKIEKQLKPEEQQQYYGNWYYSAIHILVTIPTLNTVDTIADYLGLSILTVKDALQFLTQIGLVQNTGGVYSPGSNEVFLGRESPMIIKHHTNWRLKALQAMEQGLKSGVHYSSVYSLSKKDAEEIQQTLVSSVKAISAKVAASPEEELMAINVDFFSLKNPK